MHSGDIEYALAQHLDTRRNLIIPNVYWGLGFSYEVDLLVVTPNNYAWEIEIKISKSDLKADLKKKHPHNDERIKRLYFAVPFELKEQALVLIPNKAGLFIIYDNYRVELIKSPKINKTARCLNNKELIHLSKLSAMRMWSLKRKLYEIQRSKIEMKGGIKMEKKQKEVQKVPEVKEKLEKRGRGRPKGSKNKPKVVTEETTTE